MSASAATIAAEKSVSLGRIPAWLWLGIGAYALFLINGNGLLADADTYWQISVGEWILDHAAVPYTDLYSFTKAGEPWTSSSWLAQVLYALSYRWAGWTGPVVLAAGAIGATVALLARYLAQRIPSTFALVVALAAMVLSTPHFLARPHVLALPVMVAWTWGLMSASERREAPSFWLLPLIALWANLHGGFVFGLVLVGAFALDALSRAEPSQYRPLILRWAAFGIGALIACCVTPYGWGSILASRKILELGELLHLISEWMPADFGTINAFEVTLLVLIAGALYSGIKLAPTRIALTVGLLHMALSHARNVEIFALLLPIVLLTPVALHFSLEPAARMVRTALAPALLLAAALGLSTWAFAANHAFLPPANNSPAAAIEALKPYNPKRVFNELAFGGYMIWRQMPVFIDGRAELYGEQFELTYLRALQLQNVNDLLDLFEKYQIDAVMLAPLTPAATLFDHIGGWQRVYSDKSAVAYLRSGH